MERKLYVLLMNEIHEPKLSAADRRERTQYLKEFGPAIGGYVVVLIAVLTLVDEDADGARVWYLLPVVPMVFAGLAVYRSVQRSDEYGRLVQLEAMALGFAAAMLAAVTIGFLGVTGVAWTFAGWLVFGAGMFTWALAVGLRGARG